MLQIEIIKVEIEIIKVDIGRLSRFVTSRVDFAELLLEIEIIFSAEFECLNL